MSNSSFLIEALSESGPHRLARAWADTWNRGSTWRRHLMQALLLLEQPVRHKLRGVVRERAGELDLDAEAIAAL